ncbi:MAG: DUF3108 domain-containing protein [Pseudomonadota bacterium]
MLVPLVHQARAAELQPFSASFKVTWHGMTAGRSTLELQRLSDDRWSYSSRSSAQGLFRLVLPAELQSHSEFSIRGGQIVPEHFTGDDGTDSKRRDQDLKFDWEKGRVTGVAETKPVDLPLQPGLQDGMSIQVALIHALLAGHPPSRFLMVDKTKIKEYIYTEEGRETVNTPRGPRQTVVYRSGRPGSEDGTWFWCDPELSYLPVKVERRAGAKVEWSMTMETAKVGGI